MLVSDIVARARYLAKDVDGYRWADDQELVDEINDIMIEIGNELQLFKDTITIDIFNGQAVYDYPDEIIELLEIRVEDYNGSVILPSSLQVHRETGRSNGYSSSNVFLNTTGDISTGYSTVAFSDTVNYGQIRLDPTPVAEARADIQHVWTP